MDLILAQELVQQALKNGASDAYIHFRQINENNRPSHKSVVFAVSFESGAANALLMQGSSGLPAREVLLQTAKNLVQAAKLAHTWGQVTSEFNDTLQRFYSGNAKSVLSDGCQGGSGCSGRGVGISGTGAADARTRLEKQLIDDLKKKAPQVSCSIVVSVREVSETLFHGKDVLELNRMEMSLCQTLTANHLDVTHALRLPEYRFSEPEFDISRHPTLLQASLVASEFWGTVSAVNRYVNPGKALVISGWGMAVIGHETAHLNADISASPCLIMDMDCDLKVPESETSCRCHALNAVSDELNSTEMLFSRVPDHSLVVDAPVSWVRKSSDCLEITFAVAYEIVGGVPASFFQPVTLRIHLRDIWQHSVFAAQPCVRIAIQCREGKTDFQSPWVYFEQVTLG